MGRIEQIAEFAKSRDTELAEKEMAEKRRIEEYKAAIKALKPRIDELISVGRACQAHNIPLKGSAWGGHEGYDTHQFITNSWSHLLGFVETRDIDTRKPLPFSTLGIWGGGACHWNLETDGSTIEVSGDEEYVLRKFVEGFDTFETEFYKYVDALAMKGTVK